jgi:acetolactate synthase-1/2/3 large subunit
VKVSEYVADWIASINPRVYAVCGAGAMHLNDAICHHPDIEVIAVHHEQAAAFAAEADARVSGKPGIVLVTAGPGGTNAITGVASAHVDSIPMIVIAGQVGTSTLKPYGMRQLGMNELNGKKIVEDVTKLSVVVPNPEAITEILAHAGGFAVHGRPGPVWIEIPLDVQNAEIHPKKLAEEEYAIAPVEPDLVVKCKKLIKEAKQPLLIIGNGARQVDLPALLAKIAMPVVSSWNGSDLIPTKDPLYVGRMGLFGDRASNYAVQHADLILAVGTRLSVAQIGHHPQLFAPAAKKVFVDIDYAELHKLKCDIAICADAKEFATALRAQSEEQCVWPDWQQELHKLKQNYPTMRPEYRECAVGVNAYHFIEQLPQHLEDDAVVVTDVGVAFIATMQTLQLRAKQRLFHSSGVSAMGYGLPAAIGAYKAAKRQTVCLVGDGGLMVNLHELQTVAYNKLPITIFVYANNGYMTIQKMQENHFGRHSISSPETGLGCPDFSELARALGIPCVDFFTNADITGRLGHLMKRDYPVLGILHISPDQALLPRVQSRLQDGKFLPTSLDQMFPEVELVR